MERNAYELGLVSVSFRDRSPQEILEAMKLAGLTCIEWGSDVHASCNDAERLRELAMLQAQYGISCASYGTYFRLGETPIEDLQRYIDAAHRLGTDTLRLWCGAKSGDCMSREETDRLLEACKIAASIAEKNQVTLCMECHKGTYTQRVEDALKLMREVDSPRFQMYWQPFQWQEISENLDYANKIAPFTKHIHVFQWKGDLRFSLEEGVAEWQEYLRAFSAPRVLLLEFMPDNRIESLAWEAEMLKRVVGGMI